MVLVEFRGKCLVYPCSWKSFLLFFGYSIIEPGSFRAIQYSNLLVFIKISCKTKYIPIADYVHLYINSLLIAVKGKESPRKNQLVMIDKYSTILDNY